MSVVVQISDTHFGTERPEVVAALVRFVRGLRSDVVVLSGDITQRARRSQFAASARFCRELGVPRVLAIPGNHDIPLFDPVARLFRPYANFERAFGRELEPEHESDSLLIVTVNTTRAHRHKHGEVSPAQIERVSRRLSQAGAEQLRIVVVHQPVHVIARSDENNLLRGCESAVRAWARAGADLVAGGHIHLPYVRELGSRFSELERKMWAVQAGTAVSRRIRGGIPNSINVIRYDPSPERRCRVERYDHDASRGAFVPIETHELALERSAS